jgi:hypothetical protein
VDAFAKLKAMLRNAAESRSHASPSHDARAGKGEQVVAPGRQHGGLGRGFDALEPQMGDLPHSRATARETPSGRSSSGAQAPPAVTTTQSASCWHFMTAQFPRNRYALHFRQMRMAAGDFRLAAVRESGSYSKPAAIL